MQSRLALGRSVVLRPAGKTSRPGAARFFTRQTSLAFRNRPQLPFLSVPLARNQQFRYLTTERKRWLAYEVFLGFKYIVYTWAIVACLLIVYFSVLLEWLERQYPSPHEWRFITRLRFRLARWGPERKDVIEPDWVQVGGFAENVLKRLEDLNIDGADLRELLEGGIYMDGIGKSGYDITAKSEPWRRGYYEVLMLCAKAAEQLDNHVLDKKRGVVFPADQVHGPSNPNPKPIPPGSPSAPHEDDCENFYEAPEHFYMRILTTRGFTSRQKMDAALAHASWLDYKGLPEASEKMYEWALQLATESNAAAPPPYDPQSLVLRDDAGPPSANVLTALTALAVHRARNQDVATALPMLIAILRARRALPETATARRQLLLSSRATASSLPPDELELLASEHGKKASSSLWSLDAVKRIVAPPAYPPPPESGELPPVRDAAARCEEAGLDLYIGEIIYASGGGGRKPSSTAREEGVAWTREAVDIAEEQLHQLGGSSSSKKNNSKEDDAARKTCRECLDSGLNNWSKMVARLAREEREKGGVAPKSSSWFGFWGKAAQQEEIGRWAAEENVVKERTSRARELLEDLDPPQSGLGSIFWA
jgi:hypothetical protein